MKRLVIELENQTRRSLTVHSGERMEAAIRRYAVHLKGHKPVRVFLQEYDPRLSSKFRYTPTPQLLTLLSQELRQYEVVPLPA